MRGPVSRTARREASPRATRWVSAWVPLRLFCTLWGDTVSRIFSRGTRLSTAGSAATRDSRKIDWSRGGTSLIRSTAAPRAARS